jgi:hypothetical protein
MSDFNKTLNYGYYTFPEVPTEGLLVNSTPYDLYFYSSLSSNEPSELMVLKPGSSRGLAPSFSDGTYLFLGPQNIINAPNKKAFIKIAMSRDSNGGIYTTFYTQDAEQNDEWKIWVNENGASDYSGPLKIDIKDFGDFAKTLAVVSEEPVVPTVPPTDCPVCPEPVLCDPCPEQPVCPVCQEPVPCYCPDAKKERLFSTTSVIIISIYSLIIILLCLYLYFKLK